MVSNQISVAVDDSGHNPPRMNGRDLTYWSSTRWIPEFSRKEWWTKLFKLSCMLGVLTDPFFFYVPIVNEKKQCIEMDKGSMIGTILSRAIADIPYVVHMILRIHETRSNGVKIYEVMADFVMNLYAIVPLLYVIVLNMYSQNNTTTSFGILQFAHFFVLIQYIPRVARVYQLATKRSKQTGLVWLQMLSFSIFLFVLASHVVGSFWYISSIQRLMACWKQYNCGIGKDKICQIGTLFCDNPASTNFTSLKFSCHPSHLPNTNATHFDYGIFLDLIQSKLLGKPNLKWPPQKLVYCFWWGLQNLSSLGQNLKTSTSIYENYFAILIFVSGMVIYTVSLSGNLQLLGKLAQEKKMKQKMDMKNKEIGSWLSTNGLDDRNMKEEIMKYVKEELGQNRDVHMEDILSILPAASVGENNISSRLRLACLKKVPELQNDPNLEKISGLLRLVMYHEASYIIREGEPLDMILFIVQGLVRVHTTGDGGRIDSSGDMFLETGDIYGQELINTTSPPDFPITNRIVKSVTRVGAFVLLARDLNQLRAHNSHPSHFYYC